MRDKIIIIVFLIFSSMLSLGQEAFEIKGMVADTMATYKLENTSVVVIRQKDSVLVKNTLANANGGFVINELKAGKYILLLSYPGYADYVELFTLDALTPVKDFGNIEMILKATLLNDVIIKGKAAAIKINGDTTEFNAGSYIIKPNSKVEDLLRQLPGIQVDRNGQITAQGKNVSRVLVDGEEFFGDDPTLVTRNIRGDMVDKVQLFDKKSDLATFTGIDDGKRDKTINVKLKEDKKNGYFGKLASAFGTKKFHESQAMLNIFRNKEKVAVYGAVSGTGALGLSMGDAGKYSTSDTELKVINDGIGGTRMLDAESFKGTYDGRGMPLATGAGLHYENKWDKDRYALNSNYRLGSLEVEGTGNEFIVNNLPGQTTRTNSDRQFNNYVFRQKLDAKMQVQLDSLSTLKLTLAGTLSNNNSSESFDAYTLRDDDTFQNKNMRKLTSNGKEKNFYANALWNRKLRKPGRTISVNVTQSSGVSESTGFLNSLNEFFDQKNTRNDTESIDQYKANKTSTHAFNSNIAYTEPIWKALNVLLNYGLNLSKGESNKQSLNNDGSGSYTLPDEAFSSNFILDQVANTAGAIFNYQAGKSVLNFGTKIENISYKQHDLLTGDRLKRTFTNWNPQVSYNYQASKQATLNFSYNGKVNQPDINQIQPLRMNNNPLYETLGNPELNPSFTNSFNLSYTSYKTLGARLLSLFGSYVFTNNPFSSSTVTDDAGKTIVQSVNIKDRTPINYFFQINSSRVISKVSVGINAGISGFTNYNLSNSLLNTAVTTRYFAGPTLSRFAEKFDFRFSVQPFYNNNSVTLKESVDNNQWGVTGNFNSTVPVPGKLALTIAANYEYNGPTQAFDNTLNRLIVDIDIYKTFFKNESLRITLYGKDLLDQNTGFIRNVNNNMIRQERFSTIRRYFLLALSWDFSKMAGGSVSKN